jgi:hypothetical protein
MVDEDNNNNKQQQRRRRIASRMTDYPLEWEGEEKKGDKRLTGGVWFRVQVFGCNPMPLHYDGWSTGYMLGG